MTNKQPKIRFSHDYPKLPKGANEATLLEVFTIHRDALSPTFIDYDTHYYEADGSHFYKLPSTMVLVLLFEAKVYTEVFGSLEDRISYKPVLFTTIRSKIGMGGRDKEEYYRGKIGEDFEIVIEHEQ